MSSEVSGASGVLHCLRMMRVALSPRCRDGLCLWSRSGLMEVALQTHLRGALSPQPCHKPSGLLGLFVLA